jgi:hypothetical protein
MIELFRVLYGYRKTETQLKVLNYVSMLDRELRAHVLLGPDLRKVKNLGPGPTRARSEPDPSPSGPRPGVFFTNMQHPVCTRTYRDHGLTAYNWLSREKNRYTIISWYLFLSISAPKIKSCRLVEKSRTKVLYIDLTSIVFRF